ncbi:MAG TPA: polysaccharide deacetylase family protein [Candidatus Saccharimonadales bacterium]|nr:polysaccharide deacetylase family protein [Candidatus Saccharimonadales bacterium]
MNPTPTAKVSFTFDDGLTTAVQNAAPALAQYGFTGTDYVISGCVGTTGTCPANPGAKYMTWPQVTQLQNTYHWEIGSHSVTHPELTQVNATRLTNELVNSKATLQQHGFNPTSFATPYGDYNNAVLAGISKYYASHRPFWDTESNNLWPYNDYLLYVKQVQAGVTVAQVKTYIDQAKQNNAWLILVLHDIKANPSANPDDYEYSTANLKQIAAYVQAQNLPVVNVSAGTVASTVNMMPNNSFDNGIADGWTTDAPQQVIKNTANNGSYPSPTNAIELTAATGKSVHLFGPKLDVDSTASYMLKNFLNVDKLTSGEVTFYIDEYDQSGNWISGQYKSGERSTFVEDINLAYKPSSINVKKASLQIAVSAGSGIHAFVDNSQWFKVSQ